MQNPPAQETALTTATSADHGKVPTQVQDPLNQCTAAEVCSPALLIGFTPTVMHTLALPQDTSTRPHHDPGGPHPLPGQRTETRQTRPRPATRI